MLTSTELPCGEILNSCLCVLDHPRRGVLRLRREENEYAKKGGMAIFLWLCQRAKVLVESFIESESQTVVQMTEEKEAYNKGEIYEK